MEQAVLEAVARALPVFPLPRIVLMPRDVLPLHVFEPRYRALVNHALRNHGLLGMATLMPGFERDYYGSPPVYDAVSIGEIVRHQRLPDGRSNIVVQWLARATIVEELIDRPVTFRTFRTRGRRDGGVEAPLAGLRQLVLQLGAYSDEASDEARRIAQMSAPVLVDYLAGRVLESTEDRLAYVAIDDVESRARLVEEKLADLVGGARGPVAEA